MKRELPTFRTKRDFVMTGRRVTSTGETFNVGDSVYADDTALPFCSRADVEQQTPELMTHFGRWGMEVHAGSVSKKSKSEVLFCAAPPSAYTVPSTFDGADLSPILLPGGMHMPIVERFPYLGDVVARDGSDSAAVQCPGHTCA